MHEGLSASEVGKEIAEHREHATADHTQRDRAIAILEAVAHPSYMPQYRIPQEAQGMALTAKADAYFSTGEAAAATADRYVRLTVLLAAVLFLVGIASRLTVRSTRYGLVGVAGALLVVSVVQLLSLSGPPS